MKKLSGLLCPALLLMFSGSAFARTSSADNDLLMGGIGLGFFVIYAAVVLLMISAQWKLFVKAGEPGWACIVPIYNLIVLVKIAGQPEWWVILFFVPFANIVIGILVTINLSKNFGQTDGFAIGMILLPFVFYPILGFGDSQYSPVVQSL